MPDAKSVDEVFDPWENYIVPDFPLEILPAPIARFVIEQARVVGCDRSALAMACLAAFSGALDHRFRLKMMRHGTWYVSPRLWVLLLGDVSVKKTPIINAALAEIETIQRELQQELQAAVRRVQESPFRQERPQAGGAGETAALYLHRYHS